MECTCYDENGRYDKYGFACPLHVQCDEQCGALEDPQSLEELQRAHDHWKNHSYLHGCSHGS